MLPRGLYDAMNPTLSAEILAIVVVGQFNPAIVTPAWLEREQLASPEEVANVKLRLIHPDVSDFTLGEKNVQVIRQRLMVSTSDARFEEALRDLATGILELLRHTPTDKVGLNYEAHFALPSTDAWHEKGHELAPKPPWEGLAKKPGLLRITMRDNERSDGYRDITAGPLGDRMLRIYINDHYDLQNADAAGAMALIGSRWQSSIAAAREIATGLAKLD